MDALHSAAIHHPIPLEPQFRFGFGRRSIAAEGLYYASGLFIGFGLGLITAVLILTQTSGPQVAHRSPSPVIQTASLFNPAH